MSELRKLFSQQRSLLSYALTATDEGARREVALLRGEAAAVGQRHDRWRVQALREQRNAQQARWGLL